jgi:hypothetical protein
MADKSTTRTGLYVMVFLIMLSTFCSKSPESLDRKLDEIKAMQPCRTTEVPK